MTPRPKARSRDLALSKNTSPAIPIIPYAEILHPQNIKTIHDIIHSDGIIIYPTDTLYGLGGNFLSPRVIEKIDIIKNRRDMPYSAAVPDAEMLETLVETVPPIFQRLKQLLPGKFTFLFNVSPDLDPVILKKSDKIGIRIPDVPPLLELVRSLGVPLVTTSVNRSGEPALNDPAGIMEKFIKGESGKYISLVIDAGVLPPSGGSTILDITTSPARCLRKGDEYHRLESLNISFEM